MDSELRYKKHVEDAASKGLNATLALCRLKAMSPRTTRRLFNATVVPVVDYASTVWMHAISNKARKILNQIQKIGGQAVTGAFSSVAKAVIEAEAYIRPIPTRHQEKAVRSLIDLYTLLRTHPLTKTNTTLRKRFSSPLQAINCLLKNACSKRLETVRPYAIAPWAPRISFTKEELSGEDDAGADAGADVLHRGGVLVATTAVEKGSRIAYGVTWAGAQIRQSLGRSLGCRHEQNPYTVELQAVVADALDMLSKGTGASLEITVATANRAVLQAISNPGTQSGQGEIIKVYDSLRSITSNGNTVHWRWIPMSVSFQCRDSAKQAGRRALDSLACEDGQAPWIAKSTYIQRIRQDLSDTRTIPDTVGKCIRDLDRALPGPHTKGIYDALSKEDGKIVSRMRTGCIQLNQFLARIRAVESATCSCGAAPESPRHFLFGCRLWIEQRKGLYEKWPGKEGNLRFFLGAKGHDDNMPWKPELGAIRAMVCFAKATGRLNRNIDEG